MVPERAIGAGGAPAGVSVHILGPLRLVAGGRPVPLRPGAQRMVLNVLAAVAPRPARTDELTEVVFGDAEPGAARRSLATAVWRVRRSLGADGEAIETSTDGYRLGERAGVDVGWFEERLGEAHAVLADDPSGAAGLLRGALDLWRGPALADWRDHPMATPVAARLEELRLGATEDLADALLRAGRVDEAVAGLEPFLAEHPLREHGWSMLVAGLGSAGRTTEAWQAFDLARLGLAASGLDPGMELRAAADGLSRSSRPRRVGATLPPAIVLTHASSSFVGRDDELSALLAVAAAAESGTARAAIVTGEAGVGKSRLVAEVATASATRMNVWYHACDAYLSLPYRPLAELVSSLLESLPDDDRRRWSAGPLGRLVDRGDHVLGPDDGDPERARYQLHRAIGGLVAAVTAGGPVLLVLEDAHRAPAATLDAVRHLLVSLPEHPVCVVLTVRPTEDVVPATAGALAELERVPAAVTVALRGLDTDAVGSLLIAAGTPGVDDTLSERVAAFTGGNPLFALALARDPGAIEALRQGGAVRAESLDAVVEAHLRSLEPSVRAVLGAAAVLGGAFDVATLEALAGSATEALDIAVAAGLLRRDPTGEDRYAFVHAIIQTALHRRLDRVDRCRFHLAVARLQAPAAAGDPARLDEIAHHLRQAWPHCTAAEAAGALRAAGERAARQLDFDRAVAFFADALQLLATENDPRDLPLRIELQILVGDARLDHADREAARSAFAAAAGLARLGDDSRGIALVAMRQLEALGALPEPGAEAEALAVVDEALAAPGLPHHLEGHLLALLHERDPGDARTRSTAAIAAARRAGDDARLAALLEPLSWSRIGPDRVAVSEELIELGCRLGDRRAEALGRLRLWLARIHLGLDRFDDSRVDELGVLVADAGRADLAWDWTRWRTVNAAMHGAFESAARLNDRALRLRPGGAGSGPRLTATRMLSSHGGTVAYLSFLQGDPVGSLGALRQQPSTWTRRFVDVRAYEAVLLALAGRKQEARPLVAELTPWLREPMPPSIDALVMAAQLAHACAAVGDADGRARAVERLLPYAGHHLVPEAVYLGVVDQYLGLVAMLDGDPAAAVPWLESGLASLETVGALPYVVRVRRGLAAALRARGSAGDDDRAGGLERSAEDLAARFDLAPPAERRTASGGQGVSEVGHVGSDAPGEANGQDLPGSARRPAEQILGQ